MVVLLGCLVHNYRNFLKKRNPNLQNTVGGGNFVLSDGTVVGQHKGYPFYTIGQRKGLDIALGRPMYVSGIDPESNTVVSGDEIELERVDMHVSKLNYIKYDTIIDGRDSFTKIRYKSTPVASKLHQVAGGIKVSFDEKVKGIAPGQSAVFYEGSDVMAGGIIMY